jgi:glycosyltransferase involved in cell wall biosynthesis
MRVLPVVPAFEAARTVGDVVRGLRAAWPSDDPVIVVDDGSNDDTRGEAERAGAVVVRHAKNLGKGAALVTGFRRALELGADTVVSVDADAQHPPDEAARLASWNAPGDALVLGVRDLAGAGAPKANQRSNAFSNLVLSAFARRHLSDTQCGLRRYPIRETLALGVGGRGYSFEAEALLRAARAGWRIDEVPVRVVYPPESERVTHFHVVRDPTRIVARVLVTVATTRRRR